MQDNQKFQKKIQGECTAFNTAHPTKHDIKQIKIEWEIGSFHYRQPPDLDVVSVLGNCNLCSGRSAPHTLNICQKRTFYLPWDCNTMKSRHTSCFPTQRSTLALLPATYQSYHPWFHLGLQHPFFHPWFQLKPTIHPSALLFNPTSNVNTRPFITHVLSSTNHHHTWKPVPRN